MTFVRRRTRNFFFVSTVAVAIVSTASGCSSSVEDEREPSEATTEALEPFCKNNTKSCTRCVNGRKTCSCLAKQCSWAMPAGYVCWFHRVSWRETCFGGSTSSGGGSTSSSSGGGGCPTCASVDVEPAPDEAPEAQ